MKVGRRTLSGFAQRLLAKGNYAAIPQLFVVHRNPFRAIVAEVLSTGEYPQSILLRTPIGPVSVRLYSPADLSTLNLIFCRRDYVMPPSPRTVIDIGSNIGLSTVYWLTRSADVRVYCYEPAPQTFQRLEQNVSPFVGRTTLEQAAVSNFSGTATLGIEESGVYSSLDLVTTQSVKCKVLHINDILETVLTSRETIDVLKIDSEGHELRTLKAIDPRFWPRIRTLNVDCKGARDVVPPDFRLSRAPSAERFSR